MLIPQNIIYINPTLKLKGHIRTIALDLDKNVLIKKPTHSIMSLFFIF